ncbi:MAG: DUF87 domain-containing protein [Candidatus Paceibacterota bacterium]
MEKSSNIEILEKFSSPEEEIKFLKERIAIREKELSKNFENVDKENLIREEIRRYVQAHPDDLLEKGHKMISTEAKEIALELSPETHDKKMEELLSILAKKGLKNTLSIVQMMGNVHIQDDFHRFLVQFFKAGFLTENDRKEKVVKSLGYTLFEVSFPENKQESDKKPLEEIISSMEQWYEGILSTGLNESITLELASAEGSAETAFYISVPDSKKNIFEKQLLSVFPKARIYEKKDDYNVFNYSGISIAAEAHLMGNPIFPLKIYDRFDYDPLNVILNAFSKINKDGEGAAIQFVLSRDEDGYIRKYKEALQAIQNGMPLKKAIDIKHSLLGEFSKTVKDIAKGEMKALFTGAEPKEKKEENNEVSVEEIKRKVATPIVHTNIRVLTSAPNRGEAEDIMHSIIASFSQFENTLGTTLIWKEFSDKSFDELFKEFSYRTFNKEKSIPLSIGEVTTLIHFPQENISSPHLKTAVFRSAPAPMGLAQEGVLLGVNRDRNVQTHIYMSDEDRLRHLYVIGQTGTGKTTFLKDMIAQDIQRGAGVCMIDPHGNDIQDILSIIPPERVNDVIYFDPGYAQRPMALNMLEYDVNFPEQKTFVVNEMLSIFNKLFDMKTAGGPMFEQYFRNAVLLVMEDPESGNTLFDVSRVLSDKNFREMKLTKCNNPIVVQFWREIAGKAGGEASLQNIVPYITSKFDVFLSNDIMRPIISQEKSVLNFREIMDNKKILLVNLSKGRLGDINANLIGLIIVGKILMAALSRADSFGKEFPPFYLFIDEFQNITTDSISQILSEARKYQLSLTVANQFIAQLEDEIKDSVFGNVGSIAAFRVGAEDAEYLEKQFQPVFEQFDLMNLDNRNVYMKLLSKGRPVRPFSLETLPFPKGDLARADKLKELSYLTYGKDRKEVEAEIRRKYESGRTPPPEAQINPFSSLKS